MEDLYYSDYIELDKILDSQHPKSFESLEEGNDEMLFIIIHQVYELWFKQIIFELDLVRHIFIQEGINDNSDDMSRVVHKLKRIGKILELINQQVSVLETMTALDFLEFRNVLLPASGFQSRQFRLIEAKLGLKMEQRYKAEYYKHTRRGSLSEVDLQEVNRAESESTLKELIIKWLERMPYLDEQYWKEYKQSSPVNQRSTTAPHVFGGGPVNQRSTTAPHASGGGPVDQRSRPVDQKATASDAGERHRFWIDYRSAYRKSLSGSETGRLKEFDKVFF